MSLPSRSIVTWLPLLLIGGSAAAQEFRVIPETFRARDVSRDGRVIVGETETQAFYWRWQEDPAPVIIGGTEAWGVSDDGNVIAGRVFSPTVNAEVAARWTEATGWVPLGDLPTTSFCVGSWAYAISGDGSSIAGLGFDGCDSVGFLWTEANGTQPLENLPGVQNGDRPNAISQDGSLIAGFAGGFAPGSAALWWASDLSGAYATSAASQFNGLSSDGTFGVGRYRFQANELYRAFRWTQSGGFVNLGSLDSDWGARGWGVSADGTTIVGADELFAGRRAWMWTESNGMVALDDVVASMGYSNAPALLECYAVSDDGNVMVGWSTAGGFVLALDEVPSGAWTDLGFALAGAGGEPQLSGTGTLQGGQPFGLELTNAAPRALALLCFGAGELNLPLLGGTLVPDITPPGVVLPLFTDAAGQLSVSSTWPAALPAGLDTYWQYWIADATGPELLTASNGLRGTTP